MHTQSIYIKYAILGIICAIALAYVVLLIATNNLIVASAAGKFPSNPPFVCDGTQNRPRLVCVGLGIF